ncbi:glycosyltransferase, partial [Coleofasciculus sp.]|uniref:glycosyltransferase n=1 Tax=Coleofasciculus sp. TaxID=3100458 RepID=UPI003A3FA92B
SGIPVITVDSGAVSEYIIQGVNGYLVPPNDVEGLANGIHKALSNNNSELIQNALRDAKQFSLEQGCENLSQYYQQLLDINSDDKKSIAWAGKHKKNNYISQPLS